MYIISNWLRSVNKSETTRSWRHRTFGWRGEFRYQLSKQHSLKRTFSQPRDNKVREFAQGLTGKRNRQTPGGLQHRASANTETNRPRRMPAEASAHTRRPGCAGTCHSPRGNPHRSSHHGRAPFILFQNPRPFPLCRGSGSQKPQDRKNCLKNLCLARDSFCLPKTVSSLPFSSSWHI